MILLLLACTPKLPEAPQGVLLVTIDTWRSDHFTADRTPNAWALGGARFQDAWSPIGLTTAAHASLFTGQLPPEHGLRGNNHHGYRLPESATTVAEVFQSHGWATGGFVSAYPARLEQGFDTFSAPGSGERAGGVAVDEARAWIGAQTGPWFAWVHLYEPHGPYQGSGATDTERYAQEVLLADRLLGPLFTQVEGSWVVLTSDHGEVHQEEACGWQHARSASPMVLRVPLVIAGPGVEASTPDQQVGLTDLYATLLELPGLEKGTTVFEVEREVWVGESGYCEATCAPGCAPMGFVGKDRVAYAHDGGRLIDRPGVGLIGDTRLLGALEGYAGPTEEPSDVDIEQARLLGYTQ